MSDFLDAAKSTFNRHFSNMLTQVPVEKLLSVSEIARKKYKTLQTLLLSDDCQARYGHKTYFELMQSISLELTQTQFEKQIREARYQQMFRLYLRELAGFSDTKETTRSWSDFADAVIIHVLQYCVKQLHVEHGYAKTPSGHDMPLAVIALGKLGGQELNFSSDIDIIFAFQDTGSTDGPKSITHQEYFTKIAQNFIKILHTPTVDGFVFRVDLRLRPFGKSGPLVLSFPAMETYYQEEGRDWERYAMVKARLVGAQTDSSACKLTQIISPFVYRRYVDFSVIESLRGMKVMIEREVKQNPMLDDIKRGKGGIRELEFVIQSVQLIRGGRLSNLRQQNAMKALNEISALRLMDNTKRLEAAYWFLRKLENVLQAHNDQQIHCLPSNSRTQEQVTLAMGFDGWNKLTQELSKKRSMVHRAFLKILGQADIYIDEQRILANQLSHIWQGHVEPSMAINHLTSLNYQNPEKCYQMLESFRQSPKCRRLSQAAQIRLNRFMILLLNELADVKQTDEVLLQVMHLLDQIVGRSVYLALLSENPLVLKEILYWFERSAFITSLLVKQPFLLEVLIDQPFDWIPQDKITLQNELRGKLSALTDEEMVDEILRQFKLTSWLLAARSEHYQSCSVEKIANFLADVAEVIIQEVLSVCVAQLKQKYPDLHTVTSQFAIIAYGKLGAREMNYLSDLDLVFLHTVSPQQEPMINRLSQKIIHSLTLRLQAGVLYTVDTRLRPSGSAGLLVSHMDAFEDYQRTHAWTWEHQALVRSRPIFGKSELSHRFYKLKEEVLLKKRSRSQLITDIHSMKERMCTQMKECDWKYTQGGLVDLEFLVQYLVLSYPQKNLIQKTNIVSLLKRLVANHSLTIKQYEQLLAAYMRFHEAMHQAVLQSKKMNLTDTFLHVQQVMKEIYGD